MSDLLRTFLPEKAKAWYRTVRGALLSLDLRSCGAVALLEEERRVSGSISVVVAVHDAPAVTARCFRSLEAFQGNAEVVIVDDGSRLDQTKELLPGTCQRLGWKLITNETAVGHSRASEAGVAASSRPYVCLLNSDALVTGRSWLGIVRAFESSAKIAVAGPSTSYTPTPQQVSRAVKCRRYWSDEQVWCFAEKYVARHRQEPIVDLPFLGGFAFFVRRSAWDEAGGFDKKLADYGNEIEFCRRIKTLGYRLAWSKGSYIHHLGSESYGKTLGFRTIRERCLQAHSYIQTKWGA
jgi:GT2 family glycosyltransferase